MNIIKTLMLFGLAVLAKEEGEVEVDLANLDQHNLPPGWQTDPVTLFSPASASLNRHLRTNEAPEVARGVCFQADPDSVSSGCLELKLDTDALGKILDQNNNGTLVNLLQHDPKFAHDVLQKVSHRRHKGGGRKLDANDLNPESTEYEVIELMTDTGEQAILIVEDEKVYMAFMQQNGTVTIRPCPQDDAAKDCYVSVKNDPRHIDAKEIKQLENMAIKRAEAKKVLDTEAKTNAPSTSPNDVEEHERDLAQSSTSIESPSVVSMAFGFDTNAAAAIGLQNLRGTALMLVEIINTAFRNSQIDDVLQMELKVAYPYGAIEQDSYTALMSFRNQDRHGADVAALVIQGMGDACGRAFTYCAQYDLKTMNSCPYLVLSYDCMTESIAHEYAHILGADHDPDNAYASSIPYAKGYVDTANFPPQYRTIMSYPSGYGGDPRILYYSSSTIKSVKGQKLGNANQDNTRAIRDYGQLFAKKILQAQELAQSGPSAPPTNAPVESSQKSTKTPSKPPSKAPVASTSQPATKYPTQFPTKKPIAPSPRPTKPKTATPTPYPAAKTDSPTPAVIACPSAINIPAKEKFTAAALTAVPGNANQDTIQFEVNTRNPKNPPYLRLQVERDGAAPIIVSFGAKNFVPTSNGIYNAITLTDGDNFEVTYNGSKQMRITLFDKDKAVKSTQVINSANVMTGNIQFAGENIVNLVNIQCNIAGPTPSPTKAPTKKKPKG